MASLPHYCYRILYLSLFLQLPCEVLLLSLKPLLKYYFFGFCPWCLEWTVVIDSVNIFFSQLQRWARSYWLAQFVQTIGIGRFSYWRAHRFSDVLSRTVYILCSLCRNLRLVKRIFFLKWYFHEIQSTVDKQLKNQKQAENFTSTITLRSNTELLNIF